MTTLAAASDLMRLLGDPTRVRLTHLGFGEGPGWDETYAYFDSAWSRVLDGMRSALAR